MYIPEQGERTLTDFGNWSKLQGIYFEKHPSESGMIRTRHVRYNTIAGRFQQSLPSNWHHAEPTPQMRVWSNQISRAVTTMQAPASEGFY